MLPSTDSKLVEKHIMCFPAELSFNILKSINHIHDCTKELKILLHMGSLSENDFQL